MLTVEDIMAGPDYFRCERLSAVIRKAVCIDRYERALKAGKTVYNSRDPETYVEARWQFEKCLDCPQGREIRAAEDGRRKTEDGGRLSLMVSPQSSGKEGGKDMTEEKGVYKVEPVKGKTKQCSKCGEVKPLTAFHKNKHMADGVKSACKACCAKQAKAYWARTRRKKKGGTVVPDPRGDLRIQVAKLETQAAVAQAIVDLAIVAVQGPSVISDDPLSNCYQQMLGQVLDLREVLMRRDGA